MLCVYVCCVWARACVYVCVCCYRKLLNQVLERHEVTVEEKARIEVLRQEQATASRTQVNQNRKARISVLFTEFERLMVMVDLFRGILYE